MKGYTVIGEKILVEVKKIGETEGGIILPEEEVQDPWTGTIVGLGEIPEKYDIKEGDKITWLGGYGSMELIGGKEYFVIRPEDIIGKHKIDLSKVN